MTRSILEAVKMGLWNFEPHSVDVDEFEASEAMPGTREKLDVLAERLRRGMPLWHDYDRRDVESLSRRDSYRRKPR